MKPNTSRTSTPVTLGLAISLFVFLAAVCVGAVAEPTSEPCTVMLNVEPDGSPFAERDKGAVSEGFELAAELDRSVVARGDQALITLTLRNVSRETLTVTESYAEHDYRLNLLDPNGRLQEPTGDASSTWWNTQRQISPGEHIVSKYVLNKTYDLSAVGNHEITVGRKVFKLDGEGVADVVSNTVVLTVSDAPAVVEASVSTSAAHTSTPAGAPKPAGAIAGPRLVAVRPILERHGCLLAWDRSKGEATVTAKGLSATFRAGSSTLVVGDQQVRMWSPAKLVNGRLQAPGDAVSHITAYCAKG